MKKTFVIIMFFAISFVAVANQADDLVAYANSFIGAPYRSGGTGPRAFDCSGFTSFVYAHFGYKLNHNSAAQVSDGKAVKRKNVQKGDLIFFKGANASSSRVGHVGIVVSETGETPIRFVHASTSAGVRIDDAESDYYSRRYVCICRVLPDDKHVVEEDLIPELETPADTMPDTLPQPEDVSPKLPTFSQQPRTYVVNKDDTMYSLSRRFGCTIIELQTINGMTNNNLSVGQVLRLPDPSAQVISVKGSFVADSAVVEPQPAAETIVHVVKKGETLYAISKRYNCSVEDICEWNGIKSNVISIGQRIKIQNK